MWGQSLWRYELQKEFHLPYQIEILQAKAAMNDKCDVIFYVDHLLYEYEVAQYKDAAAEV
jgi:hypothetical protein